MVTPLTPFSLSELITQEERDDVLATLLSIAASVGAPTTAWQEGDPILTMLTTSAQKDADLTVVASEITKGGFGDLLPSDGWADLWAWSRFKVLRVAATSAAGLVDITNISATTYTLNPGELIIAHATTGAIYRNTGPVTIAPGSVAVPVVTPGVAIAADVPGTASNAATGAITVVVRSLPGVSVNNAAPVLGTDQETTPNLVIRARSKLGAFSPNGPKDAYNYAATSPDITATSTPITRTRTTLDITTGIVTVYLATANGVPTSGDVAIVQASFDANVEPWTAQSVAAAATPHPFAITYQVWIKGSQLTVLQIQTAIANALAIWFSLQPVGGYVIAPDTGAVYVQSLQQVIGASTPGIQRVAVTLPASDTALSPFEVPTLSTITPLVTVL